jgi:hypothetical protein
MVPSPSGVIVVLKTSGLGKVSLLVRLAPSRLAENEAGVLGLPPGLGMAQRRGEA